MENKMGTERKKRKIKLFNFKKNKKKDKTKAPKNGTPELEPKEPKLTKTDDGGENKGGSKLQLVNGTRKKRRIMRFIAYGIILAIIITLIVLNALSPTGLIEAIQNSYVAMGEGSYPISVYSSNATQYYNQNGMQCVLNGSFFELYNNDGKLIQAVSHGMSNPNIKMSEARYLLYDRGRYTVSVFNYSDELYSVEFDKAIVSADIGRDGTFAVVTDSDTFQNTVYVYDKDHKKGIDPIFKWNAANYYVTDVAVADDGESIAVTLLNSKDGSFESFVYILSFDSEAPVRSYSYSDIVSSVESCGENYMIANGFDRAYIIPWNGGEPTDLAVSGVVRHIDTDIKGNSCVIYGREDNEQVNTVVVTDLEGKTISRFEYNNTVTDVCISESGIALLHGNGVELFNFKGNSLGSYASEVKGLYVGLTDDADVLILDNTKIVKVKK